MSAVSDLRLLRRYEPVLRFTQGELFLPMPVEGYLDGCGLWRSAERERAWGRRGAAERLCAPGELTPALAQAGVRPGAGDLWLRFVDSPLAARRTARGGVT